MFLLNKLGFLNLNAMRNYGISYRISKIINALESWFNIDQTIVRWGNLYPDIPVKWSLITHVHTPDCRWELIQLSISPFTTCWEKVL